LQTNIKDNTKMSI